MGEPIDKKVKEPEKEPERWILMLSLSPIAFLLFLLAALFSLLRVLCKVALLFIVVAITTPFLVMYNLSALVENHLRRFQKPSPTHYYLSDPRASLGIEVKILVSDFMKQVAGELLVTVSTGIITYFTAPLYAFYVTLIAGVVVVFHKWLNTDCLSKTALSCLCDGYGLSPLMFLFSFIGLFDIGCHPVAKCSFAASQAFLFVEDEPNQSIGKSPRESNGEQDHTKVNEENGPMGTWTSGSSPPSEELQGPQPRLCRVRDIFQNPSNPPSKVDQIEVDMKASDKEVIAGIDWHQFNDAVTASERVSIEFLKWNAFERGLFQLNPRIDFITLVFPTDHGEKYRYVLKSFMVLKLFELNLCEYPVERLELPEDYSKTNELFNFLVSLSENNGFVTDKMRGRYEHSLTLLEITEGVEKNKGYKIVHPVDRKFVVAGCTNTILGA